MDGVAERAGAEQWRGLLEATRRALATLRADDLERLAAEAERMAEMQLGVEAFPQGLKSPPFLGNTDGLKPVPFKARAKGTAAERIAGAGQRLDAGLDPGQGAGSDGTELARVKRSYRLLDELLLATRRNIDILHRTSVQGRRNAAEVNLRWVR